MSKVLPPLTLVGCLALAVLVVAGPRPRTDPPEVSVVVPAVAVCD